VLLPAGFARGAEWVSPDGQVAIAAPAAGRFTQEPSTEPPGLVRWVSNDATTVIAVIQAPMPANAPLERAGLEEGTLNQLKRGRVVSSTAWTISGVPAHTIVAQGNLGGADMFLAQVIVAFDGQVYKLVTASPADPLADADVGPVLRSLRILNPSPVAPAAAASPASPAGPAAPAPKSQWDRTNQLSVKIAEVAFLILAVAVIAAVIRKRARRRAATVLPPPLPPQVVPPPPPRREGGR
jgi:hypothetical protein